MTDQELLTLNAKGFIPGPGETETEFLTRVSAIKQSFTENESIPRAHWDWTKLHIKEIFAFEPESLVAFYSNHKLAPWQGAACWIDERNIPQLQLREGFKKGRYLGLYSREEVLSHESIHAARAAFDEPENEEFFAYGSSEKKWRQVLGPIVKRPWEVWIFCGTCILSLFWEGGIVAPLLWIGAGLFRLARQHRRRSRAAGALRNRYEDKKIRSIIFRLTDLEIRQLAQGKQLQGDDTLRWRLIRLLM